MLIYSFITDYQAFSLQCKDNTTRDKNETKVGKQSANLGKNNEPIQNRLSFLIDCKSVTLHHITILSFPMVRPAWDNWWLLVGFETNESTVDIEEKGVLMIHEIQSLYCENKWVRGLFPTEIGRHLTPFLGFPLDDGVCPSVCVQPTLGALDNLIKWFCL